MYNDQESMSVVKKKSHGDIHSAPAYLFPTFSLHGGLHCLRTLLIVLKTKLVPYPWWFIFLSFFSPLMFLSLCSLFLCAWRWAVGQPAVLPDVWSHDMYGLAQQAVQVAPIVDLRAQLRQQPLGVAGKAKTLTTGATIRVSNLHSTVTEGDMKVGQTRVSDAECLFFSLY